jgi:hypothetical protein
MLYLSFRVSCLALKWYAQIQKKSSKFMPYKVILCHIILLHTSSVPLRESSRDSNVVPQKTSLGYVTGLRHMCHMSSYLCPLTERPAPSLPWLLPSSGNPAATACTTTFLPIVIMDSKGMQVLHHLPWYKSLAPKPPYLWDRGSIC